MARLPISDFSGGITDSTFTSPENCSEVMDNFLINRDKTMTGAPGAQIYSATASRVPSNKRISKFARIDEDTIVAFSGKKAYKVTEAAITEILGPTGNHAFNLGNDNSIVAVDTSNNQLVCVNDALAYPIKIYKDENGDVQLRTAGLPPVASNPTITPSVAGTNNYVYAFVHYYEYRVGNILFQDYSTPIYVTKTAMNNNNAITAIPVLSNGADYNFATTAIKVQIYRTANNGVTFYYVGEVTNGTTLYTDTVVDATLILRESLYITGGIQPNDMPPPSKVVFEANDTYYWLNISQSSEQIPYRLLQSQTNDFDSVPADYSVNLKGDLVGGGPIGRSPIVFTKTSTVRLDGIIDETGKGSIAREELSTTVGAISHNSIVKGSKGLYWAAQDGFYFTNGYSAPTKLAKKDNFSSKIDKIYKALVETEEQRSRIQGAYDPRNNRVIWTVQQSESDNDVLFVYEETHDSFTTLSNEAGILPTALLMDGEDIIVGDSNGYLFRYSYDYYNHPVVDTSEAVADWIECTIKYRWKGIQFTMGDASVNKWITKINLQGNPETNINMLIKSYTNGEPESKDLFPLRLAPTLIWGDPAFTWGDEAFTWNRTSTMNQTRSFPKGRLRARQRQIELTNAYYTILESTALAASYVTINTGTNTATLVTPASYSFGLNNELYDLVIDGATYQITSGTEDTLVLADPDNTLVNGNHPWKMKGYGKGQRPHVLNFTIDYEPMSDAGTFWRGGEEA